ncbi:Esterase/lipase/thioesterase [Tulasnella sp. 408]|nr:Esterase/lipase/thioesterase [Tulasnella sp. 408]
MANCNGSCDSANAKDLDWFKIDESGLISGTVASGYWGSGKMIDTNNTWTSTVPSCIPAGNYLIRFETIALHSQPAQWQHQDHNDDDDDDDDDEDVIHLLYENFLYYYYYHFHQD